MITEDYVSFETAKLLKEKGFDDEYTNAFYDKSGILYFIDILSDFTEHHDNDTDIAASTLYVAMKWLREVHKIGVFPSTYAFAVGKNGSVKHVYGTAIINLETYELMTNDLMPMPTYEEAAEAAIKYCLENLI